MRLKHRNMVVFPQPDGPINAVIWCCAMDMDTSLIALKGP